MARTLYSALPCVVFTSCPCHKDDLRLQHMADKKILYDSLSMSLLSFIKKLNSAEFNLGTNSFTSSPRRIEAR